MKSGWLCSVCLVKVHDILQIPQWNGICSTSEEKKKESNFFNIIYQRPNQAFQCKIWEKCLQALDSGISTRVCGHQVATHMRQNMRISCIFPYLSISGEIANISGLNVRFIVWIGSEAGRILLGWSQSSNRKPLLLYTCEEGIAGPLHLLKKAPPHRLFSKMSVLYLFALKSEKSSVKWIFWGDFSGSRVARECFYLIVRSFDLSTYFPLLQRKENHIF